MTIDHGRLRRRDIPHNKLGSVTVRIHRSYEFSTVILFHSEVPIMATTNHKKKHDADASDAPENPLLHTALLRGNLSITTHDIDIRRQEDLSTIGFAGALSNLISIETDYILQVSETAVPPSASTTTTTSAGRKSVQFDKSCKFGSGCDQVCEGAIEALSTMETYHCSKRYVDLRNLASELQDYAEDIVKYYASSTKDKSKNKDGRSAKTSSTTTLYDTLEKWAFQKPIEAVQFLTNTESKTSNLVSTLDSISNKGGGSKDIQASTTTRRRTSDILHKGSPFYVRHVLLGVDRFYEAIYSERRQFSKKTNVEYVTKVAERRRGIIDRAFSQLMQALSFAELGHCHHHSKGSGRSVSIPMSLMDRLIRTLEKFLLTDVLLDGVEGDSAYVIPTTGTPSPKEVERKSELAQDEKNSSSIVRPMSTSRRASVVDRREVMRTLYEEVTTSNLILSESLSDDDDTMTNINTGVNGDISHRWGGVLPDHPTDFAILVGFGSLFFKVLEGRVMSIHLDIMLAFGIVCGLMGYQIAQRLMQADREGKSDGNLAVPFDVYNATQYHSLPSSGDETSSSTEFPLPRRRSSILTHMSTPSMSDSLSVTSLHPPKSLRLLRKSISSVRAFVLGGEDEDTCMHIPVTKTFPQFPDAAAIGSHLNCWSSPPSANFHVRGSNYLRDKEKVPSDQYLFPCRGCDLFLTDTSPTNVGRNRSILGGTLRDVPTFIINYRLPWGVFLSYHEIPNQFLPFLRRGQGYGDLTTPLPSMDNMSGGERALCNFLLSSTEEKNQSFKIIPMVVEGPWVVKRVVGGKPAIIGKKLPITYVYQPPEKLPHGCQLAEYFEADLDIVSSAAARNILAVVRSYTQVLTIDLGFVVQGNSEEELPEQMMLGLRLHGLDPLTAELLPVMEDGTTMLELDNEE